ncbi:hypothetical protein GCM10023222_06800 [Saccharopolyspora cebuensis]
MAIVRNPGESCGRFFKAARSSADYGEGTRSGRHVQHMEAITMNETYTAPELTEVGELTADTLGDVGTEWDFTMLYL